MEKSEIMTTHKLHFGTSKYLNCEKNQKLKLWEKKSQPLKNVKKNNCDKTKKSNGGKNRNNLNFDINKKIKFWQHIKTQIATKLNSSCDKTENLKLQQELRSNKTKKW